MKIVAAIFIAMLKARIPLERLSLDSEIIFFTGAGISAESGLSTFRDIDGYWAKYDPMVLASREGFQADPELVLAWYHERRLAALATKPNLGHLAISQFQKLFPCSVVITQNVDGLHTRAGNDPVWELHGSIHAQKCFKCGAVAAQDIPLLSSINYCGCGGKLRPDVVWFGENLSVELINRAFDMAGKCDLLFSIGTSSQVYPAAQLPYHAQQSGAFVIEINPERTPFTDQADLNYHEPAGEILPGLYEELHAVLS